MRRVSNGYGFAFVLAPSWHTPPSSKFLVALRSDKHNVALATLQNHCMSKHDVASFYERIFACYVEETCQSPNDFDCFCFRLSKAAFSTRQRRAFHSREPTSTSWSVRSTFRQPTCGYFAFPVFCSILSRDKGRAVLFGQALMLLPRCVSLVVRAPFINEHTASTLAWLPASRQTCHFFPFQCPLCLPETALWQVTHKFADTRSL